MKILSSTTVQKVSDNIHVLTDKGMEINSTLLIGKKDCILVDTRQNISLVKELQSAVKSITHEPIKHLINTHYHGDHTFGILFRKGAMQKLSISCTSYHE